MDKYERIMNKCRPAHDNDDFSARHPKMPIKKRAKLFAPFDALRGFSTAMLEREHFEEEKETNAQNTNPHPDTGFCASQFREGKNDIQGRHA